MFTKTKPQASPDVTLPLDLNPKRNTFPVGVTVGVTVGVGGIQAIPVFVIKESITKLGNPPCIIYAAGGQVVELGL